MVKYLEANYRVNSDWAVFINSVVVTVIVVVIVAAVAVPIFLGSVVPNCTCVSGRSQSGLLVSSATTPRRVTS